MQQTGTKEYKTLHDWVGEVIHRRLTFDYKKKWYKHKPESVRQNEMYKIHWNLEMQTDHQIPIRKQDLVFINKKRKPIIYWILLFQQSIE